MRMLILYCLTLIFSLTAKGQNSVSKIRESREKTLKEIEYANRLLQETRGKTKQSLNEVNLINHKLVKRKEYLTGLEVEVNVLQGAIERNQQDISRAELEIDKIKRMYAMMIRNLYKNKIANYQTMYFAASENLNQFYKRIHTVKLYNNYLKKEREKLDILRLELISANIELEKLREAKDMMVNKTRVETLTIQKEVFEKNKLVKQLTKKQKEIEEEIRSKERTAKKLENELKKIIEEESKVGKTRGSKDILSAEDKLLSTDFEKNSGKLPWPTQRGIITGKYGEHQHPDYKNVMVRNNGIYISTAVGENARSIFKGVISSVFILAGENYTVIIKHGKYFSIYHNIINVRVKQGQSVGTKEIIGTVYTDATTKETILYFHIWRETEKMDPELWLAPL